MDINKNFMKLEFSSKSENEKFARVVVAAFAARLDLTLEEISDIKTAVSEAVTNAIIHGYDNTPGIITIFSEITENAIYIEINDEGCGIADIEKAKEPLYTTKPDIERAGMGFTIMDNFMDKLDILSSPAKGTTVKMMKYFYGHEITREN